KVGLGGCLAQQGGSVVVHQQGKGCAAQHLGRFGAAGLAAWRGGGCFITAHQGLGIVVGIELLFQRPQRVLCGNGHGKTSLRNKKKQGKSRGNPFRRARRRQQFFTPP